MQDYNYFWQIFKICLNTFCAFSKYAERFDNTVHRMKFSHWTLQFSKKKNWESYTFLWRKNYNFQFLVIFKENAPLRTRTVRLKTKLTWNGVLLSWLIFYLGQKKVYPRQESEGVGVPFRTKGEKASHSFFGFSVSQSIFVKKDNIMSSLYSRIELQLYVRPHYLFKQKKSQSLSRILAIH